MIYRTRAIFLFYLIGVFLLAGCSKGMPSRTAALSEAHEKFLKICREEHKINVSLKPLVNTVWIYVPLEEDLFHFSANAERGAPTDTAKEKPSLKYVKTEFINREFAVRYDIAPDRVYGKDPGYAVTQTPLCQTTSQKILMAVSESYFTAADAPAFFVVVTADIHNGIEIRNTFYLEDLKKYMAMGAVPQEEFMKRSLYDIEGNPAWVGDKEGRHLAYAEITMPEFLARQITNRVTFAYQKSSFTPSADPQKELLTIAADTLGYYGFKDFDNVRLHNLVDNTEVIADPATLQTYQER